MWYKNVAQHFYQSKKVLEWFIRVCLSAYVQGDEHVGVKHHEYSICALPHSVYFHYLPYVREYALTLHRHTSILFNVTVLMCLIIMARETKIGR